MSFRIRKFFEDLAGHLTRREKDVRALAVMASTEHWVQFEAAALLANNRSRYGLEGGSKKKPRWLVAAERAKLDLWISNDESAFVVEFKAVHNNKNFYDKIYEIRADLAKRKVPKDYDGKPPTKWSIAVVAYTRYQAGQEGEFVYLGSARKPVTVAQSEKWFRSELSSGARWYGRLAPAKILDARLLAEFDDAPYIDRGHGSKVSLVLVESGPPPPHHSGPSSRAADWLFEARRSKGA